MHYLEAKSYQNKYHITTILIAEAHILLQRKTILTIHFHLKDTSNLALFSMHVIRSKHIQIKIAPQIILCACN